MKAKEYLEKNYGQGHLQSVMQLDDILSIFALMDEFAEYKVKNCNAPDVVKSVCVRCGKPMANYKEDTNNCCNECWLSI